MQTPHKRSFAAEELARRQQKRPATIAIIVISVVIAVIAAGYALYLQFVAKERQHETIAHPVEEITSIAVLPFRDMSPNRDQDALCEGIAVEILNALTNVKGLSVIARTSSFAFKDKQMDVREIGRQLTVESLLEGEVRKEGNRLRVTAQLVKASDGSHIWSDRYERELSSVFDIQDEIALAVASALKVELQDNEKAAIEKRYTENTEAQELYFLGSHYLDNGQTIQAVHYFQQAIDRDPEFALAYVGLANSYPFWWFLVTKAAAEKALELDGNLAEAHAVLAETNLLQLWDIPAAEKGFQKAIELNPGSAEVHLSYGYFLKVMGRFEDALRETEQARKLNPLFISAYTQAFHLSSLLGEYDRAMDYYQRALNLNIDTSGFRGLMGRYYAMQGMYDKAIEIFEEVGHTAFMGNCYAMKGERDRAEKILSELKESDSNPYSLALLYVGLGDYDNAFKYLDKSRENRVFTLIFIKSDFQFDPLRSDPRYEPLVRKIFYESKRTMPRERQAISIEPSIVKVYAGIYVSDIDTLTIWNENGRIWGQLHDTPEFELFPESETVFFSKVFEYLVSFEKDGNKQVIEAILHYPSMKRIYTYKKIPDR